MASNPALFIMARFQARSPAASASPAYAALTKPLSAGACTALYSDGGNVGGSARALVGPAHDASNKKWSHDARVVRARARGAKSASGAVPHPLPMTSWGSLDVPRLPAIFAAPLFMSAAYLCVKEVVA